MIWRRHAPKKRCATIRLSCWQSAYLQPAMRSPEALSRRKKPWHWHSKASPICAPLIWEILHPFAERRTWLISPTAFAKQGFRNDRVEVSRRQDVDARHKAGHDELNDGPPSAKPPPPPPPTYP